jgi:hypothetical protein
MATTNRTRVEKQDNDNSLRFMDWGEMRGVLEEEEEE